MDKLSKKSIKRGIQKILEEKNVGGEILSRVLNSLVNYVYKEVVKEKKI